ncbi:MAG: nitrogen regulation protein NR(II) [Hahellaceae bacterium]|nr:nitrogen regulation protein NR(II) [Hahellaceae bacterium]MCP5168593.1 nitrogen regulation protein NR(II) [Hahellaceae bacterium]
MSNNLNYQKLLESLSTALLMLNESLEIIFLNPAAEMLFEASGKRVLGFRINDLFPESERESQILLDTLHNGHPFTRREAEFMLPSGSKIRADYSVALFMGAEEPTLLMEIQPRDRLIRISREEDLLAKQETTRILVRGLAHEIKNPLGGIRGAAQLLERELVDPNLHEYTHIIIEEADRLRNLVDRMLGPNKVFKREEVNIHEVLERVANLIQVESHGAIDIVKDYDPSIPELPGDKEQLIQAFLNISRNAMQALLSTQNGKPSQITMRTRALRQFTIGHTRHRLVVRIDIIDNGPGIPDSFLKNIFYPMVSGRPEGSGLGLSITQGIIGQHEGLVECESEPGNTNFIIYIPLERKA